MTPFRPGPRDHGPVSDARIDELRIDRAASVSRRHLDDTSWVDIVDSFVLDADTEFASMHDRTAWQQNEILRYDKYVPEKRLGTGLAPDRSPLLRQTSMHLRSRYRVEFSGVGALLYRDGDDFQGLDSYPRRCAGSAPLRESPAFANCWFGNTLAGIGTFVTNTAVGLHIYDLTGSTFMVSLVAWFSLVPMIIAGLDGGAFVIRSDRRTVALLSSLVASACANDTVVPSGTWMLPIEKTWLAMRTPAASSNWRAMAPAATRAAVSRRSHARECRARPRGRTWPRRPDRHDPAAAWSPARDSHPWHSAPALARCAWSAASSPSRDSR